MNKTIALMIIAVLVAPAMAAETWLDAKSFDDNLFVRKAGASHNTVLSDSVAWTHMTDAFLFEDDIAIFNAKLICYVDLWTGQNRSQLDLYYGDQLLTPESAAAGQWTYDITPLLSGPLSQEFTLTLSYTAHHSGTAQVLGGSSVMSVEYARMAPAAVSPVPVPAPGAILLAGLGSSVVGWLRRRRSL